MSKAELPEQPPRAPLEALPESVVEMFLDEESRGRAVPNYIDERSASFLTAYEKPEAVPGVEGSMLRVSYGYDRSERAFPPFVDFEYVVPHTTRPGEKEVAKMNLLNVGGYQFDVYHRIVNEETSRGKGIGTRIMSRVEEWAAQLAKKTGKPVRLFATIKQKEVLLDFFTNKFSYRPIQEHEALYEEVRTHIDDPTRFAVIGERKTIYRVDAQGRPHLHPVEIQVEKVFEPS